MSNLDKNASKIEYDELMNPIHTRLMNLQNIVENEQLFIGVKMTNLDLIEEEINNILNRNQSLYELVDLSEIQKLVNCIFLMMRSNDFNHHLCDQYLKEKISKEDLFFKMGAFRESSSKWIKESCVENSDESN